MKKNLSHKEKVKITSEISQALLYAHRKKICHLDLKPGNILIVNGITKIAD